MPPRVPKRRQRGQAMLGDPQRRTQLAAAFADGQTSQQAAEYDAIRPRYPQQVVEWILTSARAADRSTPGAPKILEWGAGTGILTRELLRGGAEVHAVEPSAVMLEVLGQTSAEFSAQLTLDGTAAEASQAPDQWADIVVAAQAWHWFDPETIQAELRRVLRPGGALCVVSNYLDTSCPWVHRLARIMRAGDVFRPEWEPDAGPGFVAAPTHQLRWNRPITPGEILRLATTMSSWISAGEPQRAQRRSNLEWYLFQHLGYAPGQVVDVPYLTSLHTARLH